MKWAAAFSILQDLFLVIQMGFMPTLRAIILSPSLLIRPRALSRLYFAKVWTLFGVGVNENGRAVKAPLITPNAYGVVLDIGAGHGHTANYLDRNRVTKYIALEPNTNMHPLLRSAANAAGFNEADGTLLILSCGAEDTETIVSAVRSGGQTTVDTLISILTLCSVPSPQATASSLVCDVLKPGGQLLFYEHVLSHRTDIAWWQRFWAPVWEVATDGCRIDRPSHLWLEQVSTDEGMSVWKEKNTWKKEGEDEETLFGHVAGKFIRIK